MSAWDAVLIAFIALILGVIGLAALVVSGFLLSVIVSTWF